jgi:hypothetical protein
MTITLRIGQMVRDAADLARHGVVVGTGSSYGSRVLWCWDETLTWTSERPVVPMVPMADVDCDVSVEMDDTAPGLETSGGYPALGVLAHGKGWRGVRYWSVRTAVYLTMEVEDWADALDDVVVLHGVESDCDLLGLTGQDLPVMIDQEDTMAVPPCLRIARPRGGPSVLPCARALDGKADVSRDGEAP